MVMLSAAPVNQVYDVCIVGAGPVGLSLALEAEALGLQVLLLESGHADAAPDEHDASRAQVVNPHTHAPMTLAARRTLGGSSWLWGGRCVPFEAIDFEVRDYVPHSGWPITRDDILPWYPKAAAYLDCGTADFRSQPEHWPDLGEIELSQLERWARQPRLTQKLAPRVLASPRIHILFDATVTDITFDSGNKSVRGLQVHHQEQTIAIPAARYVLAGGGLETTRLLLSVQQTHPALFGASDGPLGRYYMGHIFGSIASIVLKRPQDFSALDFSCDATGTYVRRRFTLSEAAQRQHRLLNTSFFADNPPFYDQRHRNATLSMVFLGLSIPAIGRRVITEAIRLRHIGPPPYHYSAHVMNILRAPWQAATDIWTILRLRYFAPVRKPGFVLHNQGGAYALNYHAEQIPNPESRVTLNQERDAYGMPRLTIDFRYVPADAASALQAHEILDRQLRSADQGQLDYHRPAAQRIAHIMEQATDGFHQVGTTRMSDDPRLGVVDRDCRVHGIDNLFIASSSVFPTTGEANPTFMAVALAARLAAKLAALSARSPVAGSTTSLISTTAHESSTMQTITLPGTALTVSRLAFGTASLHHLFRSAQRQALLSEAINCGFSHFDTSPLYGFGLAEQSLGQLPGTDLQRITIASKVGLYGPPGATANIADILLRKVAGKALPALNKANVDWSLAHARHSLENSLRRLRRGWLDILYLHEPVAALITSDEWLTWLHSLVQEGKIKHVGIAGEAPLIKTMLETCPALTEIVQVRDSLDQHQADILLPFGRPMQFTYGYLATAQGASVETLRQALQRNSSGAILVSTRRLERVAELARAAQ